MNQPNSQKAIVTGGGGFIGAYLVKRLVSLGWQVTVIDTLIRGDQSRFEEVASQVELITADVRDEEKMVAAIEGAKVVFHLAAINGTENFYNKPELVLDVGIRGALAIVNACIKAQVFDLVIASTAEVYQTPQVVPTTEDIPLMLPNSTNPRYSYGGSKIISELIAFNYGRNHFKKLQVFRPHNVYGPDMGYKHVIPQFLERAFSLKNQTTNPKLFEIQGDGSQTRAFCYIDDIIDGILTMYLKGGHREIYHIGNDDEISIKELVNKVSKVTAIDLTIQPKEESATGATPRRCPDISKMRNLGYMPQISLDEGLKKTADWYQRNKNQSVKNKLL